MQYLRRTVQIAVLLLILFIPLLHLYGIERYARQNFSYSLAAKRITSTGLLQRKGLGLLEYTIGRLDDPDRLISSVSGSPWSFNILGYNISDPLSLISITISGRDFFWGFIPSILFLTILSLLLGRVFCGWLCPYHLIAEMNNRLRGLFSSLGLRPHNLVLRHRNKYIVLVILLILSFVVGMPLFTHIYPPIVVSREVFQYVFFGVAGFGTFFIIFLLLTELTLSERWWCRYLCPGGAVYSLLGYFRIVRMKRDEGLCTLCGECDKVCPFGLFPMSDRMGMECDNCGLCRSACPEDALSYSIMTVAGERRLIMSRGFDLRDRRKTGTDG